MINEIVKENQSYPVFKRFINYFDTGEFDYAVLFLEKGYGVVIWVNDNVKNGWYGDNGSYILVGNYSRYLSESYDSRWFKTNDEFVLANRD